MKTTNKVSDNKIDADGHNENELQMKNLNENKDLTKNEDDDIVDDDSDDEIDLTSNSNGKKQGFFERKLVELKEIIKKPLAKICVFTFFLLCYLAYFTAAMILNHPFDFPPDANSSVIINDYIFSNNKGLALLILTTISFALMIWDLILVKYKINDKLSNKISYFFKSNTVGKALNKFGSWILIAILIILCGVYIAIDIEDNYNLVSLSGILAFVLVCIILSSNRSKINWHILISGVLLQFILGVFLTRVKFGYSLFKFIGDQVITFLDYTNEGSKLVFGDSYTDHFFAFSALPVIVFFGSFINLLFYLSIIQYVILKVSWVVNKIMGTSPCESINATANIFLVAGSVLAAYVGFGVPSNHLIIASLMAAPGALAVSKTMFPETKKTKADWNAIRNIPKGEATNIFEAVSIGASNMIGPVAGIIANLIAYTAFFRFIDAIFAWFFSMLGLNQFGLTSIMQYLFFPFAFIMGVDVEDCKTVSKLIGTKVFVNEFIAYSELGNIIQFKKNITDSGLFELYRNSTLTIPSNINMIWNERSIIISTYALCGFANFASVGMQIGGLSALAPKRSKIFSKYAAKAMIAGNITNFISACIAGLLYTKQ